MLCSTDSFNGETNYYHGELHDYDFYKLFVFLTKTLVLTIAFFFRNNDMITWKRRDNSVVHLSVEWLLSYKMLICLFKTNLSFSCTKYQNLPIHADPTGIAPVAATKDVTRDRQASGSDDVKPQTFI